MASLLQIIRFECRYQLRSPLFAAVLIVLSLAHFLAALQAGVNIGLATVDTSRLALNGAFTIIQNEAVLSIFGMFPALVFTVTAITRDHERNTAELFFAAPITERAHFFGRFIGGLIAAELIGIAGLGATLAAFSLPGLDPELLDGFAVAPYWFSLWAIVLPNTFIVCALFYSVAALTRSGGAAFAAALVFLAGIFGFAPDADHLKVTALLEPSGTSAIIAETRYWTSGELARDIPGGWVVINRLSWVGVALAALLLAGWRYRFRLDTPHFAALRRRQRHPRPAPAIGVLRVEPGFGSLSTLRQLASHLRMDLRTILLSVPFYVMLALGVQGAVTYFNSETFDVFPGNRTVPATALMLGYFRAGLIQSALLIIVYYSGELVHRDRRLRIAEIVDASPFPDGVSVISKVLTVCLVVTALMLVAGLTLVVLQAADGYTNFEFGLYAKGIFGINAFQYYMLCVLAVVIQVLSPNKWLGMLVVIAAFIASPVLRYFGFEHGLYAFSIPYVTYSDMNGFGHFVIPVVSFTIYWGAFCALLVIVGHLFYPRGYRDRIAHVVAAARTRASRNVAVTAGVALLVLAGTGAWIFYNTNVLNDYVTTPEREAAQADYERLYKRYAGEIALQATHVDLEVELFPEERRLESRGKVHLTNLSDTSTGELALFLNPELTVNELAVSGAALVKTDPAQGFFLFRFDEPLAAGAGTPMAWNLSWINRGFRNGHPNIEVVANGTYVETASFAPHGYDVEHELTDDRIRRRYGLPPAEVPPPEGPRPPNPTHAAVAARADLHLVVGTSADQVAVAPGRLQRAWQDGGRRYFEYVGDETLTWPGLAIASARYEVARDRWNDVPIEIYFDPKHPYAVKTMIETAKRALDYYTREFSPYPYGTYRMFEIPRYHTFARAFAGTIAYAESLGFLARFNEGQVDIVTAHELAHQWWGAQVMGAPMLGSRKLNETLANYSMLMVIENVEGAPAAYRTFMDLRDDYLRSRGFEPGDGGEAPLIRADSLKGHLVLYALRDVLGAERVNLALRRLIERYGFLERFNSPPPPFPTSLDFVNEIRAVAGEEHQALITDLFERVTFYDLRVVGATSRPIDGGFEVTVDVAARQLDSTAGEPGREVPLSGYFDIGLFAKGAGPGTLAEPLYLEKHLIKGGEQSLTIVVESEPALVGIDPYGKMIDRNLEDNTRSLGGPW
jgi:ABC-type transport system involved in multi-copper enzyme maturation permease subunit